MFLINNACTLKTKVSENLQKYGAINFLKNLDILEKNRNTENSDFMFLKHNVLSTEFQLNEFTKSKEFVGEGIFYTRSISDSFVDYTSGNLNQEIAEKFREQLMKCKSEMLPYENLNIPERLTVFALPKNTIRQNFNVEYDDYSQASFYPIDGVSILVVLTLNLKAGDRILDMCAAPGGKTVTILQTGLAEELVCIDASHSRIERLKRVLKEHSDLEDIAQKVSIVTGNSLQHTKYMKNYFDKVLVDVPCSSDRHAATNLGFNLFSHNNYKDRQKLFSLQHSLLKSGIDSCKIGGDIVYSTCTLSPVQNEKVVVSVINEINEQNLNFKLKIVDCQSDFFNSHYKFKTAEKSFNDWFTSVNDNESIGQIILPNIINNYGPGYMCKLRKVSA